MVLFIQCLFPAHYTMRNTLKHYENKVDFELKYGETYEKSHFKKYFS